MILLLTEINRKKGSDDDTPFERAIVVNMEAVAFIRHNEIMSTERPIIGSEETKFMECSQLMFRTGNDLVIKQLPEEIAAMHEVALAKLQKLISAGFPLMMASPNL